MQAWRSTRLIIFGLIGFIVAPLADSAVAAPERAEGCLASQNTESPIVTKEMKDRVARNALLKNEHAAAIAALTEAHQSKDPDAIKIATDRFTEVNLKLQQTMEQEMKESQSAAIQKSKDNLAKIAASLAAATQAEQTPAERVEGMAILEKIKRELSNPENPSFTIIKSGASGVATLHRYTELVRKDPKLAEEALGKAVNWEALELWKNAAPCGRTPTKEEVNAVQDILMSNAQNRELAVAEYYKFQALPQPSQNPSTAEPRISSHPNIGCDGPLTKEESTPQMGVGMNVFANSVSQSNYERKKSDFIKRPDAAVMFLPGLFAGNFEDFSKKRAEYFCRANYATLAKKANQNAEKAIEDAKRLKVASEFELARKWFTYHSFERMFFKGVQRSSNIESESPVRNYALGKVRMHGLGKNALGSEIQGWNEEVGWEALFKAIAEMSGLSVEQFDNLVQSESARLNDRLEFEPHDPEVRGHNNAMSFLYEHFNFNQTGYTKWESRITAQAELHFWGILDQFRKDQEYSGKNGHLLDLKGCAWVKGKYNTPLGSPLCTHDGTPIR
ncbi:MAG: hypothetical protein ABL970_12550 [Nitrospira sp.]